jgi:hypothetical protein
MEGSSPGGRRRLRCGGSPLREGRLGGGLGRCDGTWSGQQLRVGRQDAPVPEPAAAHARWATPPCPARDGGWPATERRGDIELSYDLGDLASTGTATAVTLFHPGQNQAVLVVAAADLAAVEARLRPQLGTSLCVVPSRWTQDQLDAVRDHLHQRWQHWNLLEDPGAALFHISVQDLDTAMGWFRSDTFKEATRLAKVTSRRFYLAQPKT